MTVDQIQADIECLALYAAAMDRRIKRSAGVCAPTDREAEEIYQIYDRHQLNAFEVTPRQAIEYLRDLLGEVERERCAHEMHGESPVVCIKCGFTQD